jgi:murein L,D-transpeptidase YcbB/YkuD
MGRKHNHALAGTALALILALPCAARADTPSTLEAAVPMPEAAALPAPTANDITPSAAKEDPAPAAKEEPATTATVPAAASDQKTAAPPSAPAATVSAPPPAPAQATTPAAAVPTQTTTAPPVPADTTVAAPRPDPAQAVTPAADAKDGSSVPATAEAAPPDPFAALDPADRPIAAQMRDLLAAKSDKIFESKKEHAAVEAFYQNRTMAPLWLDKGIVNARAKAMMARMQAADADGLDPNDYKIPDFTATSPEALAQAELKMTAAAIVFTRHLQAGRFPWARISYANIELPQEPPDPAATLTRIADSNDLAKTIDEFAPPHEQYRALKAKLAELRGKSGEEEKAEARIPDGPMLRPGMEDARVPALRKHFKLAGDDSDLRYDDNLVKAVKAFQKGADLRPDGMIGPSTLRHINGKAPPKRSETIDKIIANMERWRWYPRDMGEAYVLVNIPEYKLRVYKDGKVIWETRIVTGQPSKQTPLLTADMKYITVNPTWNVPPSIINNEYLPALAQDPTVLDRMGLKVSRDRDGTVHISQPPGDGNALGRVRFNFPNRFLVYQHDTPDKYLFAREERAYSHGCMRVQDPPKYAEVLLSIARPGEHWTAERIKSMYGRSEQDIQFHKPIPVNLTYQTASVEDGRLILRKDIYGYDSKMIAAIKHERGLVLTAQERPHERESSGGSVKRARLPQPQQPRVFSFFESLFGGGEPPSSRPNAPRRYR